ncbi:protein of unknown function DUF21 [Streptomyces mirabilis]|uniref:CNNM transmembrane domain-containing protein n=1 Tax=Streptomyces mirabilis TaxID=68239 RepID=A0A1I2UBJ6_9ACTN|nr:protein of unknown function DUF21 [Streptomyces mirabilis]
MHLAQKPNGFLATIQIGITLAGFPASATAAVSLAEALVSVGHRPGHSAADLRHPGGGRTRTQAPAIQYEERWALLAATPLDILATMARPAVWTLSQATDLIVRLFGGNPREAWRPPSPEELRDIVISHRGLTAEQRTIIAGALEIHQRPVRAVLVPRRAVFTLPDGMPTAQARLALTRCGHSRATVLRAGHIDEILGIVQFRDLSTTEDTTSLTDVARPALYSSDFMTVTEALRRQSSPPPIWLPTSSSPSSSTNTARSRASSPSRTSWKRSSVRSTTRPTRTH